MKIQDQRSGAKYIHKYTYIYIYIERDFASTDNIFNHLKIS